MAEDAGTGTEGGAETQDQGEQQGTQEQQSGGQQSGGNASEAYWRRKAEQAEKKLKERERAEMTEAQRLAAERDEANQRATAAEERANRTLMQARFETAAVKAGCVDPDAAFRLLEADALRVDENGKIVGLKQALDKLQKDRPYLFGQAATRRAGTGGGNPPGGNGTATTATRMNEWIRSQIR